MKKTKTEAHIQKSWGRVDCVSWNAAAPATQPRPSACLLGTAQFREGSQEGVSVGVSGSTHLGDGGYSCWSLCTPANHPVIPEHGRLHTLSTFLLTPGEGCAIPLSFTSGRRLCHFLQSEALIGFLTWLCLCQTITHSFHPLFTHSLKASSVLNKEDLGRMLTLPSHLNITIRYLRTYKLHPIQP